jgi:ABC-type transport system substrate-binding protein
MWETASFNLMNFDALFGPDGFDTSNATQETIVANLIQQFCYKDPDHPTTNVIFRFDYPLPISAMAQIFAQTWGSIVNKDFYIAHGSWDYSFAPGWAATYRWTPDGSGNRTPIDRYYAATSLYNSSVPNVGIDVPDMCGTGPYKYEFGGWNQITLTWRLDYDPTYWRGWANAGEKDNINYFKTIIVRGIATWPTRKMLFLDGEFDVCDVPRANMFDLLQGSDKYLPLAGLNLITNITGLVNEEVFFCMGVTEDSSYQSYVGYPTHIGASDPYFFNSTAMRLAFAYALNYTQVIQQAWFGEAIQQASWWVDGLVPASSKNLTLTANMRNVDLNMMKYYLSQAIIGGQNISQVGFETTAVYNSGNDQRQIELQSIANAFAQISPKYKVNVVGLDWPIFLDSMNAMSMPVFCLGWQADYADPSNWAAPYQQSAGSFLYTQGPPFPADQDAIDAEITAAATETNMALRDALYQDLQYKYWLDVPSIPVVQPIIRRWQRDWVKGYYRNDLYPGLYAYDLYKSPPGGSVTNIDMDVSSTVAPLTTYSKVFISMGQMKIPLGGGVLAQMTFNVTVKRNDAAGLVPTIISLVRDNLTKLSDYRSRQNSSATGYDMTGKAPNAVPPGFDVPWPNGGWDFLESGNRFCLFGAQGYGLPSQIIVGTTGGSTVSVTLTWYENGVTSTLPANATWSVGALVGIPSTAGALYNDTNKANNDFTMNTNTYNYTAVTATIQIPHSRTTYMTYYLLTGDVNGDGRVDILDAIALSNSFLKELGQAGYNAASDVNKDGVVNILDAIQLANNFNKILGFL